MKQKQAERQRKLGPATPQSSTERKRNVGSTASRTPAISAVARPSQRQAPSIRKSKAISCQNKLVARNTATLEPKALNAGISIQLFRAPRYVCTKSGNGRPASVTTS